MILPLIGRIKSYSFCIALLKVVRVVLKRAISYYRQCYCLLLITNMYILQTHDRHIQIPKHITHEHTFTIAGTHSLKNTPRKHVRSHSNIHKLAHTHTHTHTHTYTNTHTHTHTGPWLTLMKDTGARLVARLHACMLVR